jgi:uncharacterized protein
MRIYEFIWNPNRIDHIARHNVTPEEVEETCFGIALVQRAKSQGTLFTMYLVKPNLDDIYSAL